LGNFGQDGLAFAIERWQRSVSMASFVKLVSLFAFHDEFAARSAELLPEAHRRFPRSRRGKSGELGAISPAMSQKLTIR
jgi:hypothetical protein